jgi:hypothetical protein
MSSWDNLWKFRIWSFCFDPVKFGLIVSFFYILQSCEVWTSCFDPSNFLANSSFFAQSSWPYLFVSFRYPTFSQILVSILLTLQTHFYLVRKYLVAIFLKIQKIYLKTYFETCPVSRGFLVLPPGAAPAAKAHLFICTGKYKPLCWILGKISNYGFSVFLHLHYVKI